MRNISWIGHLIDRYDQSLFALLIPQLAPLFFHFDDPFYSLLAAFCLFPLGFLSKPIGAYVFGRIGDQYGCKKAFSYTLFGMAAATGGIGFLPTYDQIGLWAPFLLSFFRLLQNFFAAGESTGAAILALEGVSEKRRSWISSLVDASGMVGTLLGSGVSAAALYFGISWRILFLTGFAAALAGWWVRQKFSGVQEKKNENKVSSFRALWVYRKEVAAIAAANGFSYANYYLITIFFNGFLPLIGVASEVFVMQVNTWMLGLDICLLPLFGRLAQNRVAWMRGALWAALFLACPLYLLFDPHIAWTWIFVRMAFMMVGVCFAAPLHAWSLDIAPLDHRYAVKAMGTAIGSRCIGACAPAAALWLYQMTHVVWTPALVILATASFALWAAFKPRSKEVLGGVQ